MKKTFFVLVMLLISNIALAEISNYITVQGKLTDANDLPVASGSYLFNFTVYDSPIIGSGNLIWTEQFTVTVTNGLFNTALSPPSGVAFDEPYFLEVRVGTTSANLKLLQPRVNITSAGYAFVSAGISGDLDMKGKSIENVWRVRNPSGQDLWIGLIDATKSIGFYDYANSWNVFRYNGAFGERDVDFYRNLSMNGNYVCLANGCRSDWPTSTSNGWSVGTYVTNSTANARVGIGTNSPLQVLDVRGNIHVGGVAGAPKYLRFATYGTAEEFLARHYIGVESDGFNIVADDAPATYANINFKSFTGSALTTKMKIDAATGNVGIGAIAPDEKLHVNDSTSTYMKVQSGATQISGVKLQRGTTSDAYTDYNIYDSGGNLYVDRSNAGSVTTRMFISDSTGNVGIGTSGPQHNLSLGGSLSNTKLAIWEGGATSSFGLGAQSGQFRFNVNQAADKFSFLNSEAGTEIFTILGGGNVGIGQSSPSANLEIRGTTSANNMIQKWGLGGGSLGYTTLELYKTADQNGNFTFMPYCAGGCSASSGKIGFGQWNAIPWNGVQMMLDTATGNVGIGTTAPARKLDVNGEMHVGGYTYFKEGDVIIQSRDSVANREAQMYNDLGNLRIRSDYNADNDKAGSITLEAATVSTSGELVVGGYKGIRINSGWYYLPTCNSGIVGQMVYYLYCSGGGSTSWTSYLAMCMQTGASTYVWKNIMTGGTWIGSACI